MDYRGRAPEFAFHALIKGQTPGAKLTPVRVNIFSPRPARGDFRMSVHITDLLRQALRQTHVVRVHSGYVLAGCHIQTEVQTGRQSEVGLVAHQADPGVDIGTNDLRSVIRRAVVDDNKFKIFQGLTKDTVDSFTQILLSIMDRHQDRYSGSHKLSLPARSTQIPRVSRIQV